MERNLLTVSATSIREVQEAIAAVQEEEENMSGESNSQNSSYSSSPAGHSSSLFPQYVAAAADRQKPTSVEPTVPTLVNYILY